MLNWGVDFHGGTEIVVGFAKPVEAGDDPRGAGEAGFHGADVVKYVSTEGRKPYDYMIRMGAVSVAVGRAGQEGQGGLAGQGGRRYAQAASSWSEGGDKIYLRFDKAVEPPALADVAQGDRASTPPRCRRSAAPRSTPTRSRWSASTPRSRRALDAQLGAGRRRADPAGRVGGRQGRASSCSIDGVKSLLDAILLIMIYIAFRFDFRYGPGTVVALLHDAVLVHRRLRDHLQGVFAHHGRGDVDHHRLLDERHHRRLRPHPRERGALPRSRVRPDRQPVDQRDAVAHHPDQRHGVLRDPGDERLRQRASSATSPSP